MFYTIRIKIDIFYKSGMTSMELSHNKKQVLIPFKKLKSRRKKDNTNSH